VLVLLIQMGLGKGWGNEIGLRFSISYVHEFPVLSIHDATWTTGSRVYRVTGGPKTWHTFFRTPQLHQILTNFSKFISLPESVENLW